ncbi:MAG: DUF3465 domain-containing protein [Xanthomonadales bacterium]
MKRYLPVLILAVLVYGYDLYRDAASQKSPPAAAETTLQEAYARRQGDIQVEGAGRVVKILSDDLEGSRHQRFIIELDSGQTLLVSHNIDLAPRIGGLRVGDEITFYGEYEWNPRGGVIHWTHHDPAGRHADGWIRHRGRTYR